MKRVLRYLPTVFFLFMIGCASAPLRTEFSNNAPPLTPGKYLDEVWFEKVQPGATPYSEVRLSAVKGFGITDQKNIAVTQAIDWLREATIQYENGFVLVKSSEPGKVLNLELVITELNPGDTATRFWAGEFGAGHAWVQVEGKLTDAESKKLIGYFIDRERKSGVTTWRNSRGYDSGPGLIKDMLEDVGQRIRKEIGEALGIRL